MYALPDREFAHHPLTPESLVIALPKDHPLVTRQSIALKEVRNERFILPALEAAEVLHHAVLAECAEAEFQPHKVQDAYTVQTALGLVAAGFGVSLLPASAQSITRKGVVLRPIRNSRLQVQLTLMWQPGGTLDTIAKRHGATVAQLSIAWLLYRCPVMLPIPGTSSVAHLEENMKSAEIVLSDKELKEIEEAAR